MRKYIMVKIGGRKKCKLSKNRQHHENRGTFLSFAGIEGIYRFCGNKGEYAIGIIGSGGWTPLTRSHLLVSSNERKKACVRSKK